MKSLARLLAPSALILASTAQANADIPIYDYKVVTTYPHDTKAYTEGLFFLGGCLYESTGIVGESSIRKLELKTGKVLQQAELPPPDFGEGIVAWKDKDKGRLIQLTWQSHRGYIYDLKSFKKIDQFNYSGEGWGLTHDSKRIYMSDGTPIIRKLNPITLKQEGEINVTLKGQPQAHLNELEWVKGKLYANVWLTHNIVQIDPASGDVVGIIDLDGLGPDPRQLSDPNDDVLNGIAYDAKNDHLFVTGKRWPRLYQIELVPRKP